MTRLKRWSFSFFQRKASGDAPPSPSITMSESSYTQTAYSSTTSGSLFSSTANPLRGTRSRFTLPEYDRLLVWAGLLLLGLGLVMVYSATIVMSDSPKYASYHPDYFLLRHLFSLLLGVFAGACTFCIPTRVWDRLAPKFFLLCLLLLVAVLIPHIGKGVNGARRWIPIGVMNIQPSEMMKLAVTLYVANYAVRKQAFMSSIRHGFLPMMIAVSCVGALLLLEPDMGAFMVVALITMGVLFLGGVNGKLFSSLILTGIATFGLLIWLSPWRRERIFAYLNPWDTRYVQGKAYQLVHSLIAFGRGEWLGVGLGGSVEKLNYLPEAHTDFILAVIGEELGFIGVLLVIVLFFWIVRRAFEIGRNALALDRVFSGLVAKGIGLWIGVQALINMGVNLGLLPTKGLTLPFVSYGGSGILFNCIGFAILLRVDYENRVLMRGGKV